MQITSESESFQSDNDGKWTSNVDLVSTTLCLLHRAHMPPATSEDENHEHDYTQDAAYPSRNIAFQAAGMITSIIEHLQKEGELRFTPAFMYVPYT